MTIIKTEIDAVILLEPKAFGDDRGYFFECFQKERYAGAGIHEEFVQDNLSRSVQNTVRGLHFQIGERAQGKLVQVVFGEAIDVAVDIRKGSPTYGKHVAAVLSSDNHRQLWIPPGFAHGFSVLSETVVFHYKCTNYYSKAHERNLLYNDPALGIDWKVSNPIVSEKDMVGPAFETFDSPFSY
jgi:dTDP-4-dehydrorhamnose 3,5-epimerase